MAKYRVLVAFNINFGGGNKARLEVGDEVYLDVVRGDGFVASGNLVRIL
jgi:hypothetical protein